MILNWRSDFVNFGGFDHLVQIYHNFKKIPYSDLSIFSRKILGFVLKIVRNYLLASFSTEVEGLYSQV